jgi:hypothetical protein
LGEGFRSASVREREGETCFVSPVNNREKCLKKKKQQGEKKKEKIA